MKPFYSLAVFASPKYNHIVNNNLIDQDYLIATTHFIETDSTLESIIQSFLHHYFNSYTYHKIRIVNVYSLGASCILWQNVMVNDEINPLNIKVEKDMDKLHEKSNRENVHIEIVHIKSEIFYTKDYLLTFFDNNNNEDVFTLYIFHKMYWETVIKNFRLCNLIISGGGVTSRHIFSPINYILGYFLLCLYGRKVILAATANSLHKIDKQKTHAYTNSRLDSKTRDYINKETEKMETFLHKTSKREYSTKANNNYKINSPMYEILTSTFINEPINETTQKNLEEFLIKKFQEKAEIRETNLDKLSINYKLFNTPVVKEALKEEDNLKNLIKHLKKSIQNKEDILSKIIFEIKSTFLISVLFGRLLRIISNNERNNHNTITVEIFIETGKDIINKYIKELHTTSLYKKDNLSTWKANNNDLVTTLKDTTLQFNIGSLILGLLLELKLVETKIIVLSKTEKQSILRVGPKLLKFLTKEKEKPIVCLPNRLPMIVKPKPYTKQNLGGYLLNDLEYTDSLILENNELVEKTHILKDNIIYDMVNKVSSVPFKINKEALDFIVRNYLEYDLLIDPNYIHPLSLKDKLKIREQRELESFNSKKDLEQNILGLAFAYQNLKEFYLPVRLDYRGRLNCVTQYLTYQGSDLSKALLLFANGDKVYIINNLATNYLKIYGANCFGLDKLSFKDRIKWVNKNKENIINFENGILLTKAENKLLFIAFCLEYKKYNEALKNNLNFYTTEFPIQFDASCNGWQHLILLIGDTKLAPELNLSASTWEDKPKDFYSFIALKIKDFFIKQLDRNNLTEVVKTSYEKLIKINIQRKLIKKLVMTIPYNAASLTLLDYLKEWFIFIEKDKYVYIEDPNIIFNEQDFISIKNALLSVIYGEYPKLEALVKYLKELAKIANKLNIHIPWILPTGLLVQQKYYKANKIKIKPYYYNKDLLTIKTYKKETFDNLKQIRSFMPNLVHSLDAASLALLIQLLFNEKNKNFYSIHDCFASTSINICKIVDILKSVYCKIYIEENYLLEVEKIFLDHILKVYGKDCFNKETQTITIYKQDANKIEIKIKIKIPNIRNVLDTNKLNIKDSSYLID